jgi:hypothetical protein
MTTGRINQVTIVAPVKANRPCFRAEESTRLLGRRALPPACPRCSAGVAPGSQRVTSAFPPRIPQSAVGGRDRGAVAPRKSPPKRPKRRPDQKVQP